MTNKINIAGFDIIVPRLASGGHKPDSNQRCAMEMVAFLAGEKHSAHPECACPVITSGVITANDNMTDKLRQEILVPRLYNLIGTKSTKEIEIKRGYIAADWAVRVCLPLMYCKLGKLDIANQLRNLSEIVDKETAKTAVDAVRVLVADNANAADNAAYAASAARYANAHAAARAANVAHCAANAAAYAADEIWHSWAEMLDKQIACGQNSEKQINIERVKSLVCEV